MADLAERLQRLQGDFADARIPTGSPGFYEDRGFIRREQKDPAYLDNYARFVDWQPYTSAYLETAEQAVYVVAAEMQLALLLDRSPASYEETPFVMSRILERDGIWNYVGCGALSLAFPPGSGFAPYSFWSLGTNGDGRGDHGYKWLCAPPFHVVDITIQALDFPCPVNHLLPKTVLEKNTQAAAGEAAEILSPATIDEFRRTGVTVEDGLDRCAPSFRSRFAPDFPAQTFSRGGVTFRYVPTSVVTCDASLEQFKGFVSKGRSASQFYAQDIRPRLANN
jgi:hypothetical protein